DGLAQDVLEDFAKNFGLLLCQLRAKAGGMNLGAPQAFVGVDVADTAEHALIQQQRLDSRAALPDARSEILGGDFEGGCAECREVLRERSFGEISHAAEATRVGVAKLTPVIE